jgi:ABC-type multidrug transport system fused ATPase/permease subunit
MAKDRRMTYFANVVENVEYVKINALENYYSEKIFKKREAEIKCLKNLAFVSSIERFVSYFVLYSSSWFIILYFVFVVKDPYVMTYAEYVGLDQLGTQLKFALNYFIQCFAYYVELSVSLERMNNFLNAKEIEKLYLKEEDQAPEGLDEVVSIKNGYFKWRYELHEELTEKQLKKRNIQPQKLQGKNEKLLDKSKEDQNLNFELKNINLSVKKGERIAIVGASSSGKSSLMYAILVEMIPKTTEAEVILRGKYAYLTQTRWLMGGSVKQNITLGKPYDEETMSEALKASHLMHDLEKLTNGIDTELGDNGSTVSGGQRARIGLARCFYQE